MSDETQKVAWVTGSAKRVGKAIVLHLADEGWDIVVHCRSSVDEAEEVAAEIQQKGQRAVVVQGDHSKEDDVVRMIGEIKSAYGKIDALVNCAAAFPRQPFPETSVEDFTEAINANLLGPFLCAREVLPLLKHAKQGRIINILDSRLPNPYPNHAAYWCAKGGFDALTRALATELAPKILVNGVALGPIIPPPDYDEDQRRRGAESTLVGYWGGGEEVAKAVSYLLGTDFVTGHVIDVDGGSTVQ